MFKTTYTKLYIKMIKAEEKYFNDMTQKNKDALNKAKTALFNFN